MKRRLLALAAASVAAVAVGGCGVLDANPGRPVAADAGGPLPTPSGSADSGLGAAESTPSPASLPDPCTLVSNSEVVSLTGRPISETDRDDAKPGDSTRYCQWQQQGGQLALFLARTTAQDFDAGVSQAQPVDGVEGYDAFSLAGHLYVRDNDVQVDVYSHGGTDEANLADEMRVVKVVLPRLEPSN